LEIRKYTILTASTARDSGSSSSLEKVSGSEDKALKAEATLFGDRVEYGRSHNCVYVADKWGCDGNCDPASCVSKRPFGQDREEIGYWVLDMKMRECIMSSPSGPCPYNREVLGAAGKPSGERVSMRP
jgi:hypothetical protein